MTSLVGAARVTEKRLAFGRRPREGRQADPLQIPLASDTVG